MSINLLQIGVFLLIFTILVVFHELGHFLAAKLFKMKVEEFSIGFFRPKFRFAFDGETEYNIRAVPLGGFVRIAGMEIEDGIESRLTGAETTNMHAMEQEASEVAGKNPNGFNSRPVFQRYIVFLAGPVFSFFLGWITLCLIGVFVPLPDKTLLGVKSVTANSVAADAGLKPGDVISKVNGNSYDHFDDAMVIIRDSANKPVLLTLRDKTGATRDVTVTPKAETEEGSGKMVGRIGFGIDAITVTSRRLGIVQSFELGNANTARWFSTFAALVASGEIKNQVGGPVAIFKQTADAADQGGPQPMFLLGQLSLSLGLFNLLPIPVLDGGHLVLLLLEAVRRRKLTADQTNRVLATGLAILVLLFAFVMFKDIFHKG